MAGRPRTPDSDYAKLLGVTRRAVVRLGGKARLEKLDPSARELLLRGVGKRERKGEVVK